MYTCDKCGKHTDEYLESVYGVQMCEDCCDEYLFTDEGKAEVIFSMYLDDCKPSDFDADSLGEAIVQWQKHKGEMDLPEERLNSIDECINNIKLLSSFNKLYK